MLEDKTIVLGITGSIAAYKSAEIARKLVKQGITVKVIMTQAATKFITPLTFETITSQPVVVDMFNSEPKTAPQHISLSDEADLILVAPATANILAKVANGVCDDMLSTTILAADCPMIFAPAMNEKMYLNPATQDNLSVLKKRCFVLIGPATGELVCGRGIGRLAEIEEIVKATFSELEVTDQLQDKTILVTAGPTRESLDPVRYLSNRSSGKMGYTIASESSKRGANTILVSGPTDLSPPRDVCLVSVETTKDMEDAVFTYFDQTNAAIMTAAVADFRPKTCQKQKIAKMEKMNVELVENPDILAKMGAQKRQQVLVGFAAESNDEIKNAKQKLSQKHLDLIFTTNISRKDSGFRKDDIKLTAVGAKDKVEDYPLMSKREAARVVLDEVSHLLERK